MNIQQLEYIIAVDNYRHFAKAAEASYVTQPTLSMMIQKLEDELDVKIFDRSLHPVEPTDIGTKIIEQAKITVKHFKQIKEIIQEEKNMICGELKLGIIPTIAPYLIPDLLKIHRDSNNQSFNLTIKEMTTAEIIEGITGGTINAGILATPLKHPKIMEYPIYYEKFYAYISPAEEAYKKQQISIEQMQEIKNIWLLEDVHCFRSQMLKLCQFNKKNTKNTISNYEAGSIDTLIYIVEHNNGATMIPELAAMKLQEKQQKHLRSFKDMNPVREISLVTGSDFVRKKMLDEMIRIIRLSVPASMQNKEMKKFIVDI